MKSIQTLLLILSITLATFLVPKYIYAAEITIVCDEGVDNCDVTPSDTAAVFDDEIFPHFDMKPGDQFNRTLTVTNNREEVCSFTIYNFVVNEDTETTTGELFSEELLTEFAGDGTTTGEISFAALFTQTPLFLGNIDPEETLSFDWRVKFDSSAGNEFQQAILDFDFDWTFACSDTRETVLNLSKSNDTGGDTLAAGDDVVYTIVVWTSDNMVDGVEVNDLPPDGFEYRFGSWTAQSSLRGDLKLSGITTEPTYASPGKWKLGDMQANETVTLTYIADIAAYVDPGIYPDLVGTRGTYDSSIVMGNDSYIPQYFAGTEVKIDTNQVNGIAFGTQVLGASTTLPDTGASTWITIGAVILIVVGGTSMIAGVAKRKRS